MRRVVVRRLQGRLVLRIEEYEMGKKYDAYEMAATAENISQERFFDDPSAQNRCDLDQALETSEALFREFLDDPEG